MFISGLISSVSRVSLGIFGLPCFLHESFGSVESLWYLWYVEPYSQRISCISRHLWTALFFTQILWICRILVIPVIRGALNKTNEFSWTTPILLPCFIFKKSRQGGQKVCFLLFLGHVVLVMWIVQIALWICTSAKNVLPLLTLGTDRCDIFHIHASICTHSGLPL